MSFIIIGGAAVTEFFTDVFRILDPIDPTKKIAFAASGIDTLATRFLASPNKSGTLALVGDVEDSKLITTVLKATSATASLTNNFSVIEYLNGVNDFTYTLPQFSDVSFPVGSWIEIRKTGSGDITIAKGAGVTFRSAFGDVDLKLVGADGFSAFAEKISSTVWYISGSVAAA